MFKKSNLFGPTPKVVSRYLLAYKEQQAKNHMVGNHLTFLKSENLQYNTLGRWIDCLINQASDGPSIILID